MNEQSLQEWQAELAKLTTKHSATLPPTTPVSVVQTQVRHLSRGRVSTGNTAKQMAAISLALSSSWTVLLTGKYAVTYPKVISIYESQHDSSKGHFKVEDRSGYYQGQQRAAQGVSTDFPHEGMERHRWLKAIGNQHAVSLESLYTTTACPNWAQYSKQKQYGHKRLKHFREFWIKDGEQLPDDEGPMYQHRLGYRSVFPVMKVQIAPQSPPKKKYRRAPKFTATKKKTRTRTT
ncbi:hypothetical protein AC579_8713 [Pseudocercospora musae]|uniref:Uncharacterized protein n=1 Tax=Pseudocercospora musae TaxID=113226 RepID=A0A139IW59_9PEZI|nr:hypothetical protein AC579_8713 [Pseudocercospora musae]